MRAGRTAVRTALRTGRTALTDWEGWEDCTEDWEDCTEDWEDCTEASTLRTELED